MCRARQRLIEWEAPSPHSETVAVLFPIWASLCAAWHLTHVSWCTASNTSGAFGRWFEHLLFFIKQSPTFLSHLQVKLSKSTNTPKNCHFQRFNVSFCVIQQLQVTPRWVSELVMDWHKLIKRAMNHRQGTHCQSPISLWILLVKFERLCAVRCGSVCLRATTETL